MMVLITLQDDGQGNVIINVQSDPPVDLHSEPPPDSAGSHQAAYIGLKAIAESGSSAPDEPQQLTPIQDQPERPE